MMKLPLEIDLHDHKPVASLEASLRGRIAALEYAAEHALGARLVVEPRDLRARAPEIAVRVELKVRGGETLVARGRGRALDTAISGALAELEEALDAHDLRSNPARSGANLRR